MSTESVWDGYQQKYEEKAEKKCDGKTENVMEKRKEMNERRFFWILRDEGELLKG